VGGVSEWILVIVCYFGPYFLIPKTFSMAGSAFASLAGMANDRSRGVFDRLKKGRQQRMADSFARMKSGDRYQGRNAVTRQFNKRTSGLAGGFKSGFGFGTRGEVYHDIHGREAAEEAIKNNPLLRQLAYDDNGAAVLAASGGTRAGAERVARRLQAANGWTDDQRERAIQSAAAVGFTNSNTAAAMTLLAQNKSRALTGALGGEAGMDLIRQSATQVSGGNEQMTENLMGGFAFNSRNAGRLDLGGETRGQSMLDGWQRSSVAQHAQSFGASMQAFTTAAVPQLRTGTNDERNAAATALLEMHNMLPNATGENQTHINEALHAAGVRFGPGMPSIEEQLANYAGGTISAEQLRSQARVYDAQTPLDTRGGGGVPQTPAPTVGS
jgi:hypothetical protein